jgi:hypothetical protein
MPDEPELISLLLPTRQRPNELKRLADSAVATATHPDRVELVVFIDSDDVAYSPGLFESLEMPWALVRGPRLHNGQVNLSHKWNECWNSASGDIYMHCGDDIVFRTNGWDDAVRDKINEYPGKIAFVWCDDYGTGTDRSDFGTHGFIHRNWTDVVGRFVPPYFVSDFNDTWFNDVAVALGVRAHLPQHLTEHMHYIFQKAQIDQNTRERLDRHQRERPDQLYNSDAMQLERREEVLKLQAFIEAHRD